MPIRARTRSAATERPDLLGGIVALKTMGRAFAQNAQGNHMSEDVEPLAIPYYAWAHRGQGEMVVWIAREESAGLYHLQPAP
jgi:DUF1680 family protein